MKKRERSTNNCEDSYHRMRLNVSSSKVLRRYFLWLWEHFSNGTGSIRVDTGWRMQELVYHKHWRWSAVYDFVVSDAFGGTVLLLGTEACAPSHLAFTTGSLSNCHRVPLRSSTNWTRMSENKSHFVAFRSQICLPHIKGCTVPLI